MIEIIDGIESIVVSIGSEKRKKLATKLGMERVELNQLLYAGSLAKAPPNKTKAEIAAIDAANAKKDSPTSRDSQISTIKELPPSQNVTIIYPLDNGQTKTVDMGTKFPSARAKPTKKEMDKQFKIGASWVEGNLTNTNSGFVKMPNGTIYEISSSFRSARIVKE